MLTLFDVHMPHMGSVEFALLTEWLLKPGDRVAEGDPLCEVSTDKVDTEVDSPTSGILISYVAAVDQEVPVGDVIARFASLDADPVAVAQAIAGEDAVGEDVAPAAPTSGPIAGPFPISPDRALESAAPTVAAEGSRPPNDSLVLAASWFSPVNRPPEGSRRLRLDSGSTDMSLESKSEFLPGARDRVPEDADTVAIPAGYEAVTYTAIEHTRLRRAIAKNLTESWNTAPQLTAQVDVDFTAVSVARAKINRERSARGEGKLSFLPFVGHALCRALADHPDANATFTDKHLVRWNTVNLGIAVDTPDGLIVPVIRDAQNLELEALSDAIVASSSAILSGSAQPEDLSGGTITISNSGSVGGVVSTPILTRPQVASIGLPAIVRTPVARKSVDGESELLTIRPIARLGLTFDHRAFDGAEALRTLMSVQKYLEQWPTKS